MTNGLLFGEKIMTNLAFLGLGVMGSPMTRNLVSKGFSVKAWNRTSNRAGLELLPTVSTIEEAVSNADIIFTCLGDVPDVEEVILGNKGVINYAKSGSLVVDMSTIGTNAAQNIASVLTSQSISFLDAPVSGGDIGAINGTLTIMVGGTPENFDSCYPMFAAMGKNIYLCGPVGSGQAVKLCNQILVSLYMVGISEAITLAQLHGIDPQLMISICNTGAAGSWALSNLAPKIPVADYAPGFMIKHILKDLHLIQDTLSQEQKSLPGVTLAEHLFQIVSQLEDGSTQGTQAMFRAYSQEGG